MNNKILAGAAIAIAGLAFIASNTYAGNTNTGSFAGYGMRGGYGMQGSGSLNYNTYASNIIRTVNNISSGVEITMTTTDASTLEHIKSMFQTNSSKTPLNTNMKIERTQLSNGTKLTITSTDAATVKLIQDRANSAKMGAFGMGGQGMGHGRGQGRGRGMGMGGQGRGTCLYNQ